MPDARLSTRSPLAGSRDAGHQGRPDVAGLVIQERADLEIVTVAAYRGQAPAVAAIMRETFGLDLPSGPRRVGGEGLAMLWAGEARWTIMAEGQAEDLETTLRRALDGCAAVTGQGDGRVVLRLSGPAVRDVLAKAVAVDLHARVFRPGDVALTAAFHIPVQLWLTDDGSTFELSVASSYARTLLDWLVGAGEEYGVDLGLPK